MKIAYLDKLDRAVALLLGQRAVRDSIARLKREMQASPEPFVWVTLDCGPLAGVLPPEIRSAWIFVLKRDTWSGAHYHPNSIQHMVVIEGGGRSKVGGGERRMLRYDAAGSTPDERWYVIDKNVPHEFLPEGSDVVVMSFHTCEQDGLVEIEVGAGQSRVYETRA
ncbi:MAG TPA: hypothetical protein VLG68_04750 [Gammaproteobacteria bacterium]|nr:hypothetical protein [Gammaproteobacteria bacterium]